MLGVQDLSIINSKIDKVLWQIIFKLLHSYFAKIFQGRGKHPQHREPGQECQAGGQPPAGHPCWLWLHGEECEAVTVYLKHNLQSLVTSDLEVFEAQKNHIPCSCPLLGILDSLIGSHQVKDRNCLLTFKNNLYICFRPTSSSKTTSAWVPWTTMVTQCTLCGQSRHHPRNCCLVLLSNQKYKMINHSDVGRLDNLPPPQPFQHRSFQDQETEKWKSCAETKTGGRRLGTLWTRQWAQWLRLIMGGN